MILAGGYHEDEVAQRFASHGVWQFLYKLAPLDKVITRLRDASGDVNDARS